MNGATVFQMVAGLGDAFGGAYADARREAQEAEAPSLLNNLMSAYRGGGASPAGLGAPAAAQASAPDVPAAAAQAPSFAATGGAMGDYLAQTRARESAGNDAAANPNSTALGRYQFTSGTWAGLAKKYPDLALTPNGRTDPAQQERAMEAFTRDNASALSAAGIPINPGNLYGAHFLGAGGATRFIPGAINSPDAPAASLVGPGVASANRSVFFNKDGSPKSAAQVYAWMGGGRGGAAPAAATAPAPVQQVASADAADAPAPGAKPIGFTVPEGGAASPSQAFPGFGAAGAGASRMTPELREALNAAWKNPSTRGVATQVFGQLLKGQDAGWKFEGNVNGQAAWINERDGRVLPIGQRKAEDFTLSEGQQRFDSTGQRIAGVDKLPEAFTLSPGQQRMRGDQVVASLPDRDKSADGEAKLRGEFGKQIGSFNDVQDAYGRVIAAVQNRESSPEAKSPASDIALVFGYMKMLDPGSVVREGEYATAKNAAGVPEQVVNTYNKLVSGEFLNPQQRQDFVDTAGRVYGQARQSAEGIATRYRDLAKGQGLDEGRVVALPAPLAAPKVGLKREDGKSSAGDDGKAADKTAPTFGQVKIPMPAVQALRGDPALRGQFDAKYGRGASDRVLGRAQSVQPDTILPGM